MKRLKSNLKFQLTFCVLLRLYLFPSKYTKMKYASNSTNKWIRNWSTCMSSRTQSITVINISVAPYFYWWRYNSANYMGPKLKLGYKILQRANQTTDGFFFHRFYSVIIWNFIDFFWSVLKTISYTRSLLGLLIWWIWGDVVCERRDKEYN